MYPQLTESQKSVISLYLQTIELLNNNKDPAHNAVLMSVYDLLLDELKESLKNHSLGEKIIQYEKTRDSQFNRIMSHHNSDNI
jgi:hypothetical protein